ENIDIGGPAMIRASAKNYAHVAILSSPSQYPELLAELKANNGETTLEFRKRLAIAAFRRKGGSGFYDQLFHYIHWAGYGRVQSLFERYGFKILPPPYSTHDFSDIEVETKYDTYRALCLAKAAYLVYEDREYVTDISRQWLSPDIDNLWKKMSDREYVIDVIKGWLREGEEKSERDIRANFKYLNMLISDTQAFLFRKDNNIILVFRGTQQLSDWKTNLKIRLKQFTVLADQTAMPPKGRIHRGFLDAWQSVEKQVIYYVKKWVTPDTKLWVTGHSLGGGTGRRSHDFP
ncbi:MAG: hypothetical protein HC922_05565, partial [Leptolyngbyaceae cyanobacterium SM2_3_12]|nr:hypothetical protein [Leptolyngbyaceae cyanobacterium SM2_3_12]